MTGPENYQYAMTLLDMASDADSGTDYERFLLAKAQVHATLALAAATALNGEHMSNSNFAAWQEVAEATS